MKTQEQNFSIYNSNKNYKNILKKWQFSNTVAAIVFILFIVLTASGASIIATNQDISFLVK